LDYLKQVIGGEDEDRTHDLRIANAALSQLSYPPNVGAILYHPDPLIKVNVRTGTEAMKPCLSKS
jgi:hypothetical protein